MPQQLQLGWLRTTLRWVLLLAVGGATGVLVCVSEPSSQHRLWDFLRDAAISELPTLAALKTSLEKTLGLVGLGNVNLDPVKPPLSGGTETRL